MLYYHVDNCEGVLDPRQDMLTYIQNELLINFHISMYLVYLCMHDLIFSA